MKVIPTRFGTVAIEPGDVIRFREGLIGLPDRQHWVILADSEHGSLAWLQSVDEAELALPVVSPRLYVPNYRLQVTQNEIQPLLHEDETLHVLVIVTQKGDELALNLKAPLVINLERRLGRQVVAHGEFARLYTLSAPRLLRQTA